jgi:uncharacterized protein YrzB (UPF0473 family)
MAENEKNLPVEEEELEEVDVITLIDDENGEEKEFEILASTEIDGQVYYALVPANEETDEYVILKVREDGEEIVFESVDDDEESDKVEEYFNDLFFNEIDYDQN